MATERRNDQLIAKREEAAMHCVEPAVEPLDEPLEMKPDVLGRIKSGDQTAFADLVREHQAMVFSIARHFFRDRALAEDLAQEVFLHLYQNLASIESEAHLKFWLRKVTGHRCIDYLRRTRLKNVHVDEAPTPVIYVDWNNSML